MKRMLSILAVVALAAIAVQAVDVQSENVAGVINVDAGEGEYVLVGTSLDDFDVMFPTLEDALGTDVPDNTTVYMYNGSEYEGHTYYAGAGWYDDGGVSTATVDRVTGFWIFAPVAHTFSLMGEAPDYDTPISLDSGYQIVTYPFPAEVALTNSVLGASAADNDTIYVLNESGDYEGHTYYAGAGWYDDVGLSELVFEPGMSFWYYRSGGVTNLNETVPYTL